MKFKIGDFVSWYEDDLSTGSNWDGKNHTTTGYKILDINLDSNHDLYVESKDGKPATWVPAQYFKLFSRKVRTRNLPAWW